MKPQIASVRLDDLLKRVETDFAPVAREKGLRFKVMPTTLQVRTDPNLLRRLVQNLVSNAIKYTVSGGVLIGVRRRGGEAEIQVVDTGIGIPSAHFKTVFREFARLDEGMRTASGLGLGLSIVDRLGRVLGHPVKLASVAGRGTDFRVKVPVEPYLKAERVVTGEATEARFDAPLAGLTVIVIDNEPRIVDGMRVLLSDWKCTVVALTSLADVTAFEAGAAKKAPDVIVADFHLDDGDGLEAIARLRARFADLPALLLTADRSPEVRQKADAAHVAMQHKPVRPAALRAYLSQVALTRRAAAE
jgi:CheY-like chemotaxis protein